MKLVTAIASVLVLAASNTLAAPTVKARWNAETQCGVLIDTVCCVAGLTPNTFVSCASIDLGDITTCNTEGSTAFCCPGPKVREQNSKSDLLFSRKKLTFLLQGAVPFPNTLSSCIEIIV